MLSGERGQRVRGFVFVLCHDEHDVRSPIRLKSKLWCSSKGGAGEGGTPIALDVLNDQVGARKVADVRGGMRSVDRIGQITHQRDVLSEPDHIPDTERPPQYTHVSMDAHDDQVVDPTVFEEIPDF